ncbi:metal-dependent hydrolase [Halegenticoccus soli]|uniref:metal-dependent hydrolase n=1 Tax=Halegenticoccus soli TaxID=1985678 RepID=UPI00130431CC|nr:metal-dependent hydrolase [Halegenticoccus soli]
MVDVAGHLGATLIALSPIWFLVDLRAAVTGILVGLPLGLLPDVDIWLKKVFPTIHHHGVTHTIVFVTLVSAVAALIVTPALLSLRKDTHRNRIGRPYLFTFAISWVASLSHIFGDMLASPDIVRYQPVEPFWPLYHQPITVDVIYYNAFVWNAGLLAVGVVLNLALWRWR